MLVDENIELHAWPPRPHGGQHVGISTGVLAYHRKLGIGAACTSERSQYRNREIALSRLQMLVRFAEGHNAAMLGVSDE